MLRAEEASKIADGVKPDLDYLKLILNDIRTAAEEGCRCCGLRSTTLMKTGNLTLIISELEKLGYSIRW